MSRLPSEDTPRSSRVRTVRHQSAIGWWELSFADPHPMLSSYVRAYCGWEEEPSSLIWRVEPPGPDIPVIILFASPVLAPEREDTSNVKPFGSFVAGLWDHHAIVGSRGRMAGVQVNFSPLGARLLLNQPLAAFANRMVELDDVWGRDARRLAARLEEATGWERRFAILDAEIAARIARARPLHDVLCWTIDRLMATRGQVRVNALVKGSGWSRRHLIARVRDEFGLTPKTLGRVLRLGRAVEALRLGGEAGLAEVAADCGYYDQAHFTRDFREFTGMTPGTFLKSRLPDAGGVSSDR
jgi:AraC-like DNA-binding protein